MLQKNFFENFFDINFEKKVTIKDLRPWSFSKYDTFKTCPIKFFFRYVYKIEPEKNKFLAFGSGVHLIIEKLLTKPISLKMENVFNLAKNIKRNYEPLFDIRCFKNCINNVINFVENIKKTENNFEVEKEYASTEDYCFTNYFSDEAFIRGKVDLTIEKKDFIRVIDHKTTGILNKKPFDHIIKSLKEKSYEQLVWYATLVALKKSFSNFTVSFFIIKDGKLVSQKLFNFKASKVFKSIKEKLLRIEDKLLDKTIFDLITLEEFERIRNLNSYLCQYCSYKHYCNKLFVILKNKKTK